MSLRNGNGNSEPATLNGTIRYDFFIEHVDPEVSLLQWQSRTRQHRYDILLSTTSPCDTFRIQRSSATISDRSPVRNRYGLDGLGGLGFGMVYGVRVDVKDDGLRCHVTRTRAARPAEKNLEMCVYRSVYISRFSVKKNVKKEQQQACYREECGESGLRTATSPRTLRGKE